MIKRIVVLGGGTGGTLAANRLRRLLGDDAEITVVDHDDEHVYQPGLLFVPFGLASPGSIVRSRRRQLHRGISFHRSDIDHVDVGAHRVHCADGTALPYDALVIATGAALLPGETEGLTEAMAQGSAGTFYEPRGAAALRGALARFAGGRIVVNVVDIFGLDCQCQAVEAHRRLAYVAGEANLWPSLTGTETLHLLGRVQGQVDAAYRDELIARFGLDPAKKVRAYSKGNRQKLMLIAALMTRPPLLILDEPTNGLDPLMEQTFRHCIHEARDRGQTVFLSSHILSEVEALCDRVGILRDGALVEVGTLAQMRHLSALTVEATFDGPVPDLSRVPGVSAVQVTGRTVRCHVRGSAGPLLKVLAAAGVRELLSREPSLEELFLAHYGAGTETESLLAHAS